MDQKIEIEPFLEAHKEQPVVLVNQNGSIYHVNQPFCQHFGWTKEEIEGQPLSTIIPPSLRDAHHLGFSKFLKTEVPTILGKPLELEALAKGGCPFKAKHVIVAEKKNNEWIFAGAMTPLPKNPSG